MCNIRGIFVSLCFSLFALNVCLARDQYTILDLGEHNVTSLNDSGEIAGYDNISIDSIPPLFRSYQSKSLYWDTQHQVHVLASETGLPYSCMANDINNQGVVVGTTKSGATVWQNQTQQTVASGSLNSINNQGVAAGGYGAGNSAFFVWDGAIHSYTIPGIPQTPLAPSIAPAAINDSGKIAINIITYSTSNPLTQISCPGIWENGVFTELPQLGSTSLPLNIISDMNNNGQAVGTAYGTSIPHIDRLPLLWENNTVQILSLLAGDTIGAAGGINDDGLIVGSSQVDVSGISIAVLWDELGIVKLEDLLVDPSGWSYLSGAVAINNQNQIIGYGYTADGSQHAFLMTPIPEPATMILLLAGVVGLRKKTKYN